MQVTANVILTDFGTTLPLDRRRKDALAAYARKAAWAAGDRSAQRWCERQWDLKDYEAKDLLKGNASEAVWERIVKHRAGGWAVVLPVMGSVIGLSLEDWLKARLAAEKKRLEHERQRYEEQLAEASQMAGVLSAVLGLGGRDAAEPDAGLDRPGREPARIVGRGPDRAAVEPRSFDGGER